MTPINISDTLQLSNGLSITISDQTRVYFGDFYLVRLEVTCSLGNLTSAGNLTVSELTRYRQFSYKRSLERMGVPSAEVEAVKNALLNDFKTNALPYFSSPQFPDKIVQRALSKEKESVQKYREAPF